MMINENILKVKAAQQRISMMPCSWTTIVVFIDRDAYCAKYKSYSEMVLYSPYDLLLQRGLSYI